MLIEPYGSFTVFTVACVEILPLGSVPRVYLVISMKLIYF